MKFLELAKKRYSSRKYSDQTVEKEKLDIILEAARVAPSAHNNQAYKLIVVQTPEGLKKISKAGNIYGASLAIIVCEDKASAWTNPFNQRQLISHDAVIATDHMILQATELGIDSVWVCWFDSAVIKTEFNLPENLEAINILVLGYSNETRSKADQPVKARKQIGDLVVYEKI